MTTVNSDVATQLPISQFERCDSLDDLCPDLRPDFLLNVIDEISTCAQQP